MAKKKPRHYVNNADFLEALIQHKSNVKFAESFIVRLT